MDSGCSSATICEWLSFFRQMVGDSLDEQDYKIGGPGIIVEIDETKLGKRKHNRGHMVEGVWCVGGIERTPEKKCFYVAVENRNAETMKFIIDNYVLPGSIIYTDMWKAYVQPCKDLNYEHKTVNHSLDFKDKVTGVHTNTIEGLNNGLKTLIVPRNRTRENADEHIAYFIWRRVNKDNLWKGVIKALKEIVYDN